MVLRRILRPKWDDVTGICRNLQNEELIYVKKRMREDVT